jgi:hypothetical protein
LLWVTFPFDAEASGQHPEMRARVLRSESDGPGRGWSVALQFEPDVPGRRPDNGQGIGREKKNGSSKNIAIPIRVRPRYVPWHEEAMTMEFSPDKVKFVTHREYAFGERLLVSFNARSDAPWSGDDEWEGEVSGIEMDASSDSVTVTVRKRKT